MTVQGDGAGDHPSIAHAFGLQEGVHAGGTLYTGETIAQSSAATPQEEQPSQDAIVEPVTDTAPQGDQDSSPAVQTEEEKRMVIDTVESQLDKFDQGLLTAEELQNFFKDKPEVASIANKSKRVKERYRSFVDGKHPRLQVQDAQPGDEDAPQEPSTPSSDEKPLTLKDLDQYYAQKEASLLEKQLQREKQEQFHTFAVEHGLKDETVEAVQKTATALASIHEDWSWDESLRAAYRAVTGETKGKPTTPVIGSRTPQVPSSGTDDEKVDLSQGSWTVDPKAFGLG